MIPVFGAVIASALILATPIVIVVAHGLKTSSSLGATPRAAEGRAVPGAPGPTRSGCSCRGARPTVEVAS